MQVSVATYKYPCSLANLSKYARNISFRASFRNEAKICQTTTCTIHDMERRKMQLFENSQLLKTQIYCGMYEKETDSAANVKQYCYITGGSGVTAVLINDELYFLRRDVQGTITGLIDKNNTLVEEYSYDPWGRRRNPTNWTYDSVPLPQYMHRGYTFHEMLDEFGLINMNGRCYDPVVGRFLSPDIVVQNPNNTQCYNRYSYCINNPLKYSDPSGWVSNENSYWAVRMAELNRAMWMDSYSRYCGMKEMFRELVMAQFIAEHGRPEESNGGGGGNSINNISTVMIPAIGNIVLKGLGLTGNSSISEYDFSEGTDYTISDGWPPDGAINCAPWRPTQNQVQNTPKETPSKNVDSYDNGNLLGDITGGIGGVASLHSLATIGAEGMEKYGAGCSYVSGGFSLLNSYNVFKISNEDNRMSAGEWTRFGLNIVAGIAGFSSNVFAQAGGTTYSGLDAIGAWNGYYRQIDQFQNGINSGRIFIPLTFTFGVFTGSLFPYLGNYQNGFYIN